MKQLEYTQKTKEALQRAQQISIEYKNINVEQQHIALALVEDGESLIISILEKSNINYNQILKELEEMVSRIPKVSGTGREADKIYISKEVDKALVSAQKIAENMKDEYISVEHVWMGLIDSPNYELKQFFNKYNINIDSFLKSLTCIRGSQRVTTDTPEATYEALKKYGANLVELAKAHKLEPVIGRDNEIRSLVRILSRKTKNNPVLIGEPGVGKTAIVEGLAIRIVRGDVPESLKDKQVFSLDMGSLIAGAKYRGEFEERLKAVLNEIKASNGNILLFIDEMHLIVGTGRTDGAMDAGNLLKPMLARGELHMIGATTLDEYRKYIEKDAALERRFQPVMVNEPTVTDTISILRGLKERYELFHGVKITDSALITAAKLSDRYISDRFLPDKAIDLVDEACAMIRTEIDSLPAEMDEISRRIMQLEIEQAALKKETDEASKKRLEKLEGELSRLNFEFNNMKEKLDFEKAEITKVNKLRKQMDELNALIEKAERNYDLSKAAELKYGKLPALQKQIKEQEAIAEKSFENEEKLLRDKVTDEEIARIVSRWTGIPVSKLAETEREKLLKLEEILSKSVIGQSEAVEKVAQAILRSRAGIASEGRPIGSFMFLGPTGVGKTELAKQLAKQLFDDEKNIVRIDMSEYMEKFSVSRLIGAPPGYVGYDEGGQLTEAIRRKPYSVLLLDEIEKAHPDVFNILLQVLDDGRITDSQGRTVNFANTIIIMTSNIGSQYLLNGVTVDGIINTEAKDEVLNALKHSFRPEFLNRIDEIIIFKPLTKSEISIIVTLLVQELQKRLDSKDLKLEISDKAKEYIIDSGFDPIYGARPLKRFLQSKVETLVAKAILENMALAGDILIIDLNENNDLIISKK